MNVERFDLIAVHNLKDWKTHLATLKRWKEEGKVRYIGITTSHGRDHEQFLEVMRSEPLDFVQFSYNIEDRVAEEALLPLAQERGIATMINRPFQRGALFGKSRGHPLPEMAAELDCSSWAQFYLKFILGHPAVTCIIPATAKATTWQTTCRPISAGFPTQTSAQKCYGSSSHSRMTTDNTHAGCCSACLRAPAISSPRRRGPPWPLSCWCYC